MLQLPSTDTVRVPLGAGAVAILLPIDSLAWLKAQGAARAVRLEGGDDVGVRARQAMIASLVHTGIRGLEGVGDENGNPVEPTPDRWFDGEGRQISAELAAALPEGEARLVEGTVTQLLKWFPAYEALETVYAGPILEAQAEKNGFAPSQDTSSTLTAGTDTAKGATRKKTRVKAAAKSALSS